MTKTRCTWNHLVILLFFRDIIGRQNSIKFAEMEYRFDADFTRGGWKIVTYSWAVGSKNWGSDSVVDFEHVLENSGGMRTWIFDQPMRAQGLSAPLVHCSAWRLVRGSRTARLFETVDCVLWCWRLESILGRDIFLLFFFLTSDLSLLLCLSAHPPPPVAGPSHHHAQLRQGRPLPDLARPPPPPPEP